MHVFLCDNLLKIFITCIPKPNHVPQLMYGRYSVHSRRGSWGQHVTLRLKRHKQRNHQHEMVRTTNTKGQTVMRCQISRCKRHFFYKLNKSKSWLRDLFLNKVQAFLINAFENVFPLFFNVSHVQLFHYSVVTYKQCFYFFYCFAEVQVLILQTCAALDNFVSSVISSR